MRTKKTRKMNRVPKTSTQIIKVNETTELVKFNYDNEKFPISARELHERLNIDTRFNDWFLRMCEYGFDEGIDFFSKMSKSTGGRPAKEYYISIDMAKHICMIQRTPEGKKVRQYLIELEKAWNTPEQVMARALKLADKELNKLRETNICLLEDNERMKPKEVFADAVADSKSTILVGDLAKILKQNGIDIGSKRLFTWMRDNGYLIKRKGSDYNMPTQKSMELGLFVIKESIYTDYYGSKVVAKTAKITGYGQQYFINQFLGDEDDEF